MKLSDIAGHVVTLGLAGLVACSHAQPTPDATAQEQKPQAPMAETQKTPTAEEQYHAQGQADLDKALEALRNVSVFFEFDSAALTKDAQDKLGAVADILVKHRSSRCASRATRTSAGRSSTTWPWASGAPTRPRSTSTTWA